MYDTTTTLKRGITEILALSLLQEGEQYGYRFVRLIRERSAGKISLTEGAIYTTMYRLEEQKFVKSEEVLINAKRRRKYYSLTETGKKYAKQEIEKYNNLASGVRSIIDFTV
ncbi:MAG TPA: helix-turn-helix transcriptional regulator [Bacillota bacterium]|nr:helix-turn-helix transcriptional regulator [Bacillota bacterium]HPE37935.1 helix-turn-helix transcriptional regulator [Bacillota bacterium]